MQLIVHPGGQVRCLYDEAIDLTQLGHLQIQRGSHVEPDEYGRWFADLGPCSGPILGPFPQRSEALAAEARWLNEHWLLEQPKSSQTLEEQNLALAIVA